MIGFEDVELVVGREGENKKFFCQLILKRMMVVAWFQARWMGLEQEGV